MRTGPHVLAILDGFGYRQAHEQNAIYEAHPEGYLRLLSEYPHALLKASGANVGLLPHMIGNSEVGHLAIGSGRVTKQPVSIFHEQISNGSFFENQLLKDRFNSLAKSKKRLHIMGLLSDAGVHSHIEHLFALITMARMHEVSSIIIHPFLDGRDVPPQSAELYLTELDKILLQTKQGSIGTIHGRFYAMDRDKHWDRTERSYTVLTSPQKSKFSTWQEALKDSYDKNITDEFFIPVALQENASIQSDDAVIFFNFRADRGRQLTQAFVAPEKTVKNAHQLALSWMLTFTQYSPDFPVDVLLHKSIVTDTFFDVLERAEKKIFTIAETEKYAHVTYFFNGGRELIHEHETRILIPSKRHYATYALIPQMSAPEITQAVMQSLKHDAQDFYLINYANADMVGHSGDLDATIKAIKCLDEQLERLYTRVVEQLNGTLYITADHGKAEEMWDPTLGQPRTAHTTNLVPFLYINREGKGNSSKLELHELADIAPFILKKLGLTVPNVMSTRT